MSNASSATLGVISPQCARPRNWWSKKKSLNQSHKLSKKRYPKSKSRSTMKMVVTRWRTKKTRRGGRASHPMLDQDAKMMSKNQDEKRYLAHIKCFKCEDMGHFASRCPTKLEKKAQATHERQGNEKHHMSKEEKAQSKKKCYSCRKGDTWHIHVP